MHFVKLMDARIKSGHDENKRRPTGIKCFGMVAYSKKAWNQKARDRFPARA